MIDLLYYAGAALLGGIAGYFIGKAIAEYVEAAQSWFERVWKGLSRVFRAVGILIRKGKRLFKRLIAFLSDDDVEEYYDTEDEGIEVDEDELNDTQALPDTLRL